VYSLFVCVGICVLSICVCRLHRVTFFRSTGNLRARQAFFFQSDLCIVYFEKSAGHSIDCVRGHKKCVAA